MATVPAPPDTLLGRLARAVRPRRPWLRVTVSPWWARVLIAGGARPAPANSMAVTFPSRTIAPDAEPGQDLNDTELGEEVLSSEDLLEERLHAFEVASERGAELLFAALREKGLTNEDLGSVDLRGASLSGADLRSADLTDEDLTGADLRGANLRGADLIDATLIDVDFSGADLIGADLRGATLSGAILVGADLRGADLSRADLTGANLSSAHLTSTDMTERPLPRRSTRPRLADTRLAGAVWDGATTWPTAAFSDRMRMASVQLPNGRWRVRPRGRKGTPLPS
ncbi:pentapeptide repeat-containing protein [Nonomuraea sp. NPDC047529]|uniref:pentapeptide repeat-containing protein n=1 Tax=Nonomuraea sp. NPDC047529 TaxID=3155623 RepID=UPI0033D2B3E8